MFAYFRAPLPWTELARRTILDTFEDGCPGLAAQLAFYFLLAVFPALLFVVSLIAYLPIEPALTTTLERLRTVLPEDVLTIIELQIEQVLAGRRGGLLTLGIAGAIWSSSAAMTAIITALNRAYDIEEWRPWWHRRLLAVALTVALSLFVLVAFALVVGGTDLAAWAASQIGAGDLFARVWGVIQWPVAFALVVLSPRVNASPTMPRSHGTSTFAYMSAPGPRNSRVTRRSVAGSCSRIHEERASNRRSTASRMAAQVSFTSSRVASDRDASMKVCSPRVRSDGISLSCSRVVPRSLRHLRSRTWRVDDISSKRRYGAWQFETRL